MIDFYEFETHMLDYDEEFEEKSEKTPPPVPKTCKHSWKEIKLFTTIVYDCEKCGIKKEDA